MYKQSTSMYEFGLFAHHKAYDLFKVAKQCLPPKKESSISMKFLCHTVKHWFTHNTIWAVNVDALDKETSWLSFTATYLNKI